MVPAKLKHRHAKVSVLKISEKLLFNKTTFEFELTSPKFLLETTEISPGDDGARLRGLEGLSRGQFTLKVLIIVYL